MKLRRLALFAAVLALVGAAVATARPAPGASGEVMVIGGDAVIADAVVEHLATCTDGEVVRLAGSDRYATASAVSQEAYPAGTATVFVATGAAFADAAAAGSPAAVSGAPILLTAPDSLPSATRNELGRLDPDVVVLVGGPAAVSTAVENELKAYGTVIRVAGADRYATAAAVSARGAAEWASPPVVYLATGQNFPDALAGSAAAADASGPVLLTTRDGLPAATAAELTRLGPSQVVIVGGPAAVSGSVEAQLSDYAPSVRRVSGATRYGTAAAVSNDTFAAGSQTAWIATGENFPDALVGGAAAGHVTGPVLLVTRTSVPAETAAELSRITGTPCPPFTAAQPALVKIASGLARPVYLASPPGDSRLFIVEQGGTVRIHESGAMRSTPFLDISAKVVSGGERGLLSIAFHPQYESNGRFFVYYSTPGGSGNHIGRVSEFRVSGDPHVAATSETVVLDVTQPYSNHNGGQLTFGPDGYLYIGLGDGGSGNDPQNYAQNTASLLGSILRIDVDSAAPYASPADNPFVGGPGRDEIWAIGLRNPWRFSFDSGSLYIGDVGQDAREEIDAANVGLSGLNYGWPQLEGNRCNTEAKVVDCNTAGRVAPVVDYTHSLGTSVTGGYVYRGSELPALVGHYFYGDFAEGWVRSFRLVGGAATEHRDWTSQLGTVPLLASFGRDAFGNLYMVSLGGDVYRMTAG